jgi:outer membrane PBP1 activator LpoA protein
LPKESLIMPQTLASIRGAFRARPTHLAILALMGLLTLSGCAGLRGEKPTKAVLGGYADGDKVGLLLPAAGPYAQVADAVRDGVRAANRADNTAHVPEIVAVDSSDARNAREVMGEAAAAGATYAVGPLQKPSVDALASGGALAIPTLALNEGTFAAKPPANLFQFALSPEQDAAQVADKAKAQGMTRALVLHPGDSAGERRVEAFRRQWRNLGGTLVGERTFGAQSANQAQAITELLASGDADFVFLVANAAQAADLYPDLRAAAAGLPVIATSDVHDGELNRSRDKALDGLYFVDMPWMLGAAAEGDPLKRADLNSGLSYLANPLGRRLYAMGIDAYRLPPHLGTLASDPAASIPGQTGRLSMDSMGRIQRGLLLGRFTENGPVVAESIEPGAPGTGTGAGSRAKPEPRS